MDKTTKTDLISRQEAANSIYHHFPKLSMDEARMILHEVPSVQPQRMKGRWIPDNPFGGGYWVCTVCKHPSEAFAANVIYKYCPFCGADMREEQDE